LGRPVKNWNPARLTATYRAASAGVPGGVMPTGGPHSVVANALVGIGSGESLFCLSRALKALTS
jgi:hypothetical protein